MLTNSIVAVTLPTYLKISTNQKLSRFLGNELLVYFYNILKVSQISFLSALNTRTVTIC